MKRWVFAFAVSVLPVLAQPQNVTINVGTPEGQLMQSIGQESDEAKKVGMMEDFLSKYPKHEGAPWVAGELEKSYVKQKEFDKALGAADKVYTGNPNDLELGFNAIKAAEGKEDVEAVKKWATQTAAVAKKYTGKAPANDDEKGTIEHAKEVGTYAEYSLYAAALRSKETKQVVGLGETLQQINPKSQYMWLITDRYLDSLGGKGCATAGQLAAADSKNAEAFLYEADCSWRGQRADAVVSGGTRALEALNSRGKVEGGNEGAKIGAANFYIGTGYAMQQRWGPADKALRTALPAVRGNPRLGPFALFNLGLANYTLGKAIGDRSKEREALTYFEQSAGMKSSVQDQAARNVATIKGELGVK